MFYCSMCYVCFSTAVFYSLNVLNALSLDFIRYIQAFLDKSSMIVMKYLAPPVVVLLDGPIGLNEHI